MRVDQGEGEEKHERAFRAVLLRPPFLLLCKPTKDKDKTGIQQNANHAQILSQKQIRI